MLLEITPVSEKTAAIVDLAGSGCCLLIGLDGTGYEATGPELSPSTASHNEMEHKALQDKNQKS